MPKEIEPLIKFNTHEDGANEILIYGVIGDSYWDDVNSQAFFQQMRELNDEDVTVRINSYGGSVVAGTAIHTMLATHKGKVTAQIDGYAMSMASVIAMAADDIQVSEIGGFMIHSPWSFAAGNADELRKEAAVLDGMESSLINAYHSRTGIDKGELASMLKAETWIYAEEAVEKGFANSTIKPVQANACFNKSIESKLEVIPDALAQFISLHEDSNQKEEDTSDDVDSTENDIEDEVNDDEVEQEAQEDKPDPVAEERKRSIDISAACKLAGKLHLAEGYIEKGYSVDVVKDLLVEIKAGQEETPHALSRSSSIKPTTSNAEDIWSAAHKKAGLNKK